MYLLWRRGGHTLQDRFWEMAENGVLRIHEHQASEWVRMRVLMRQYHNTPMDLADASLVAASEILNASEIFTLDSDFYIYVRADGSVLHVITECLPSLEFPAHSSLGTRSRVSA